MTMWRRWALRWVKLHSVLLMLALSLLSVGSAQAQEAADPSKVQAFLAVCGACHGNDGKAMVDNFPNLAGQSETYLIKQLRDIRSGKRHVVQMEGILANLNDQEMQDIARYYAKLPAIHGQADPKDLKQGKALYTNGIAEQQIPACAACHGPTGTGLEAAGYPALGGQNKAYTQAALQQFKSGARHNDANGVMGDIAKRLSAQDISAVANYLQGLRPAE